MRLPLSTSTLTALGRGLSSDPAPRRRRSTRPTADRVEPQLIELAFRRLPDQERVHVVFGALAALLDQAAA